jgi:hypothetical protein
MDLKKLYNLLYKDFAPEKQISAALKSVKHENGKLYASDGHILAVVECGYPEEREGKAYRRNGDPEPGNNVRYESVIPAKYTDDISFTDRIDDLRAAVKKVYRLGKGENKAVIDLGLTGENADGDPVRVTFQASQLHAAFQLFDLLKEEFTIRISSKRCMMIESLYSESKVLIMAVWTPMDPELQTRPMFTIEEALNYKPEVSSTNKAWYE